ncbi:MAG: hypothetical protein AB7O48_13370 [Cyclobacteriaceae bacterium]
MKKGRLERLPYPEEEEDIDDPKVPFCDLLKLVSPVKYLLFPQGLESVLLRLVQICKELIFNN